MAVLTTAAFLSKWNSRFADNTTRDISEGDMREFAEDIKDSFTSVLGDVTVTSWLSPCVVATTANITLSGEQTIDGVLTSGYRVLVKNQTTQSQNGIYVSAAGAWSRSTDADLAAELEGAAVGVTQGTTQQNTIWLQITDSITLGTSAIVWQQIGFGVVSGGTLGVANGGTGATSLTSGRILFGNGTSPIGSTGPHWDNTNTRVGIGTTPDVPIHALGTASNGHMLKLVSASGDPGDTAGQCRISFYHFSGTTNPAAEIQEVEEGIATYASTLNLKTRGTNADVAPTTKLSISGAGILNIATAPTNDNTETSILVRQSDGEIQTRTIPLIESGTYTPTATLTGNVDSAIPSLFMYTRIGDKVTVWGYLDVDVTSANTPCSFELTLPIASNFTDLEDLMGVGSLVTTSGLFVPAVVLPSTGSDRADVDFNSGSTTTSQPMIVNFSYKIK